MRWFSNLLERVAVTDWSGKVAAVAAVAAVVVASCQFREAANDAREQKAVDLFVKYHEIKLAEGKSADSSEFKSNACLAIAEAIFRLREDDQGWIDTVAWMLTNEQPWILKNKLKCRTLYRPFEDFIGRTFMKPEDHKAFCVDR